MKKPKHSVSEREMLVDDGLLSAIESVSKKHAREDQLAGSPVSLLEGLSLPSLSMRYLLQNEGLPLGYVYHIVGPPAAFKSTLSVEFGRWHKEEGGAIIICEAETKPTPELRNSILNWDESMVTIRECTYLEQWQKTIIDYVKAIQKAYPSGKHCKPVAFIVDSYMGKMPQRLQENFAKKGYAERHFGEAAMLIGDWLSGYTSLVKSWPFTLIGVNHLKKSADPITGRTIYRTPGGQYLQHQNVIEIRVSRSDTVSKLVDDKPFYETILQLHTSKNSRGAQDKKIMVTLRQWKEIDESGTSRLYSCFEWWESSIRMLFDGWGMRKSDADILQPLIRQVINIQKRSRGDLYWCEELGVSKDDALPPHDLGLILEQNSEIMGELYRVLGIYRMPLFGGGQNTGENLNSSVETDKKNEE